MIHNEFFISNFKVKLKDQLAEEPEHRLYCDLERLETQMLYMATPILFTRLSVLSLLLADEWNFGEFFDSLHAQAQKTQTGPRASGGGRPLSVSSSNLYSFINSHLSQYYLRFFYR